jgi:hypothetical protein
MPPGSISVEAVLSVKHLRNDVEIVRKRERERERERERGSVGVGV